MKNESRRPEGGCGRRAARLPRSGRGRRAPPTRMAAKWLSLTAKFSERRQLFRHLRCDGSVCRNWTCVSLGLSRVRPGSGRRIRVKRRACSVPATYGGRAAGTGVPLAAPRVTRGIAHANRLICRAVSGRRVRRGARCASEPAGWLLGRLAGVGPNAMGGSRARSGVRMPL